VLKRINIQKEYLRFSGKNLQELRLNWSYQENPEDDNTIRNRFIAQRIICELSSITKHSHEKKNIISNFLSKIVGHCQESNYLDINQRHFAPFFTIKFEDLIGFKFKTGLSFSNLEIGNKNCHASNFDKSNRRMCEMSTKPRNEKRSTR